MQSAHQPLFTIITITYNQQLWVEQCINSVLASSFTDFEYIIADDGSSDETWSVINQYSDTRIRKYRNEINLREYPNRNKALSLATGKYVLYVDGDDILYKHTLRNLAEIVHAFPNAGMVWGVPDAYFGFAVLPYEFSPEQLINMLYRTRIPIGITGLSETVFKTEALRQAGGFSTQFGIGDYHIKIKLSLTNSAVFVPRGLAFWRQNHNQATAEVSKNYRSFLDRFSIDQFFMPAIRQTLEKRDADVIDENMRIMTIKLIVSNTLMKGAITDFFSLFKKTSSRMADFKLLFKKGDYNYQLTEAIDRPLHNNYNFS